MKLQKFLLILLSLMLVFTSTSFIALAEGDTPTDTEPAATNECMIVETEKEYATFADAFAEVEDGQTIKLLKDITLAETADVGEKANIGSKNFIIDGNNKQYTLTQSLYIDANNVTIKNAKYETTAQFGVWEGVFTLDNVTWNHKSGYGVDLASGYPNSVVIKNSTVNSTSTQTLINAKNSYGMDITIEDSTITSDSAAALITVEKAVDITIKDSTIDYQGDMSMIYVKTEISGVDILVEDSTITVASGAETVTDSVLIQYKSPTNVTLTGNTVLNQNRATTGTGDTYNAFFFNYQSHGTFEIDDTVVFNFNKAANQVKNSIFCSVANASYTNTVVDHGATYNISAEVLNAGFAFVSHGFSGQETRKIDNNVVALRAADGALYNPNAKFDATTPFEADLSLKAYTTSHITNSEAVADAEAETIRFPVAVDADFYAAVKDSAKFGMEIVAGTLINAENGVDWATAEGLVKDQDSTDWDWAVEGEEYAALIENINTEALKATKFAVCGFVTVTYTDGTTATFYADHSVELATSLA